MPIALIAATVVAAQGPLAPEPWANQAALGWIRQENRKCPRRIRQWFAILDREQLFEKDLPGLAVVKPEELDAGARPFGREQLPSPPQGYQVEHLGAIRLGENQCCLASYLKPGEFPEKRSVLYLWRGHQWDKLLQNEGTVDDVEGIEFIRISPRHDLLVVVTEFGGGSGIGRVLYSIDGKGRARHLLDIGNWNEGGYNLRDFDGDGVLKLVHRSRISHPASLEARLSRSEEYDQVTPILYQDAIYGWRKDRFAALGVRYWTVTTSP